MKYSLKGALLSGIVFPGLGQIILKHYKRGIVLMLTVSASLIVIAIKAAQYAFIILDKIELEGGVIDLKTITDAAARASSTSDSLVFNLGLLLIVVCWIFGIVDAYRIGKKKDLEDKKTMSQV
ncbi:hypothetical protein KAJ77_06585 [bacterium]|nr:hypothetical protein [bacterium]